MIKKIFIFLARAYQSALGPFIGNCCRFSPTCSHYCIEALKKHSLPKAFWLTLKRVLKCNPFHPGGVDEVP